MSMLLGNTRTIRERTHMAKFTLALLLILGTVLAYFVLLLALDAQQREFFNDKYFAGMGTLFSALAFAGIIYTVLLQKVGLDETLKEFEATNQALHYGELDRMYFDLLKLAVEKPHLRVPDGATAPGQDSGEYGTYAYMVWNFVETVVDRLDLKPLDAAAGAPDHRREASSPQAAITQSDDADAERLRETWGAAIAEEMRIHAGWWREHGQHGGFKTAFTAYVNSQLADAASPAPWPSAPRHRRTRSAENGAPGGQGEAELL